MVAEVYADLYFLINTCMNLLCLMLTASFMHRRIKRSRAILAAALGGLYAVFALLFALDGLLGFLADACVAWIMCVITFWQKASTFAGYLKCTAVEVLTSMILGGIMTALYTLLNKLELPFEVLKGDGVSIWIFAILSALAGIFTAYGGRFFGIAKKTKSVTVQATLKEHIITLEALVDSGNLLRDPASGRYVIVADKNRLSQALPKELFAHINAPLSTHTSASRSAPLLRFIPVQTASGKALLPAFLPEQLTVTEGRETYAADYLIAVGELGEHAQGFDAVIPLL